MITKIPIEIVELEGLSYHLFIDGTLSDNKTCSLILDTGASKTVFDKTLLNNYVEKLRDDIKIQSAAISSNSIETQFGIIKKLTIGDLELNNFESVLIDLSGVNEMYEKLISKKIWGLIGSDFLLHFKAKIDYHKKILTLNYPKKNNRLKFC